MATPHTTAANPCVCVAKHNYARRWILSWRLRGPEDRADSAVPAVNIVMVGADVDRNRPVQQGARFHDQLVCGGDHHLAALLSTPNA
jgi:hypothetical protein